MTSPPAWPDAALFPGRGLTEAEASMVPTPSRIAARDGYELAALSWEPAGDPRGTALVLHGVQSHAGWYHGLGRRLAAHGYRAVFPDRRGSGANTVARGHARSASQLIDDVGDVARHLKAEAPDRPLALIGISWGGKLVLSASARFPEFIDAFALVCPGLTPRVDVRRGERLRIALALFTGRAARVEFPIPLADPALFTADPEAQAFIAGDPLSLRKATAGLLASSFFLDRAVRRSLPNVRQPALLMLAGHDRIVNNDRTRQAFGRLGNPHPRVILYPDAHHTLEFEPDPARYANDLICWLDETFAVRIA